MEHPWAERGSPTALEAPAAAAVLVDAYKVVHGKPPALELAELELAHAWGLETSRSKGMWFFNWGNLSAGGFKRTPDGPVERLSWPGDVWRPPWFESPPAAEYAALHEKMLAGKAPSAFRALGSHAEGVEGYQRLLARPGFAPMLRAGELGDARAYAQAVFDTGYCRDRNCQADRLAPKLAALVAEFRAQDTFKGLDVVRRRRSSSSGDGAALALVAFVWFSERSSRR
jgi:hypothetical protein